VSEEIRLACDVCDRDDFDPTTIEEAEKAGWTDINLARMFYHSQWWTHLGTCSECRHWAEEYRRTGQ
jgi:hypothetical protein